MIKLISAERLFKEQEILGLFNLYAAESKVDTAPNAAPNLDMYNSLEANNQLSICGIYTDTMLVGFTISVYTELTHSGALLASIDAFFIHKDFRGFGAGKLLIDFTENLATERGAKVIVMTAPVNSRLSKVAKSFGYKDTNIIYSKKLA